MVLHTTMHFAIGITPFEATYDMPLPSNATYLIGSSTVEAVDTLLSSRQDLWKSLSTRLHKLQLAMKTQANRKHREVSYAVDDWVYVKLRPYCQHSLSYTQFNKLSKRYYGPFGIIETIGVVAYRLTLPEHSKIHNVFHCSLLKPHHGPIQEVSAPLPPQATDNHPLIEPLAILDTKWDHTTNPPSLLALYNGMV